jgi:regulator of sigma E protease
MQLHTLILMSAGWSRALQVLASLSLLVVLHEFGHFFFARLFKTRVEKFYLFFDFLFPFSGIFNFALFKKKVGDTEYGVGWFPLGGYVKISGMIDESRDKDQLALPPQPWEYRSKKAWQRLFIMLGGIMMNVLVAIVIYIVAFSVYGEDYLPAKNAVYGIVTDSLGKSAGLRNGDKIVAVGDKPVTKFKDIMHDLLLNQVKTLTVDRSGETVTVNITDHVLHDILTNKDQQSFIEMRVPLVVDSVVKGTEAERVGLQKGDSLLSVNGTRIFMDNFDSMRRTILEERSALFNDIWLTGSAKGHRVQPIPFTFVVIRNHHDTASISGHLPVAGFIGIAWQSDFDKLLEMKKENYPPLKAIGRGFTFTFERFNDYIQQFKLFRVVKPSESVGGVISFGKIFPSSFDWYQFLMVTAFISIILAFMNLLPIPGLDGGYVIFLIFELITGKKVSDKVMERATTAGLVLLMALMLYANGLDILRLFKK